MTPEEFKEKMEEIAGEIEEIEDRHICADELMCYVLTLLGYKEGVEIFKDIYKWYA